MKIHIYAIISILCFVFIPYYIGVLFNYCTHYFLLDEIEKGNLINWICGLVAICSCFALVLIYSFIVFVIHQIINQNDKD